MRSAAAAAAARRSVTIGDGDVSKMAAARRRTALGADKVTDMESQLHVPLWTV